MPHTDGGSLWSTLSAAGHRSDRALWGADASVTLSDLVRGSSLGGRLEELRGCSVLVTTRDQLSAALALIELDAVARRLVLCPADLPARAPRRRLDGAVQRPGVDRGLPDQSRRARRHPHLRDALPLAARPYEPVRTTDHAAIRPAVGRDRGPGHPRPSPGLLPERRHHPCLRVDGGGCGLRRRGRPRGLSGGPGRGAERWRGGEGRRRLAPDSVRGPGEPLPGPPGRSARRPRTP